MRLPKLTVQETAEILVIGFFVLSVTILPDGLLALARLFVSPVAAAQIVAIALSLLVAIYIVSSAKTIWVGYRRLSR